MQTLRGYQGCKPLLHSSHPYSTTHSLLVSCTTESDEELQFVPLDLRLVSTAGRYLSLLASKSTQLHNVLRYIRQVQRQMYSDFKASQDLPSRFMANIEETLGELSDCNWTQAAYHLVVTGNCHPEVKEWLVDQLGERVCPKPWYNADLLYTNAIVRAIRDGRKPLLRATKALDVWLTRTYYLPWRDLSYLQAGSVVYQNFNPQMLRSAFQRRSWTTYSIQ